MKTLRAAVLVVVVSAFAPALFGQNILTNPGFDINLNGWQNQGGIWSTLDAASSPSSGSVQVTHPSATIPQQLLQCKAAVPQGLYAGGVKFRIPSGQTTTGFAVLRVWTFTTTDCSGNFQEVYSGQFAPTATNIWNSVQIAARVPEGAGSVRFQIFVQRNEASGNYTGYFDDGYLITSDTPLLLNTFGRFSVETSWQTSTLSGEGHAKLLTSDSGYFWFFNSANIEVVVKVLDGCGLNNRFWVFAAGLTDVRVTMTVTDRTTGRVKVYTSTPGVPYAPIQDTDAFPCS